MSYQVFARKYRPRTFKDVLGQDHVVRTLCNAIEQKRLAHAYLFVGPRGTGKTSTARIFAKALNCTDGPRVDFDPDEEVCREIAEGRSLDVQEIDGASNRGIDNIRDLRDNVQFTPSQGKYRIIYIDEVHMLTKESFNALLKTLEEPQSMSCSSSQQRNRTRFCRLFCRVVSVSTCARSLRILLPNTSLASLRMRASLWLRRLPMP